YSNFGIKVPRTSREQAVFGKAVDKSQLQKGDILLFAIHRSGVDHVGIYVGGGEFVHAANSKKGVAKDKLNSDFYTKHYVGARRAE
ncbi:MAG: C40 family peptidase, partial [Abditibacteriota bacterium]|nr:C40 family peptidase [Abditibacteriota bacterium]